MIELRDLEFRYGEGDFRLRIRELAVERGSRVAVVGPSGSGKTTFLHLVAGISVPRSGRVVTSGIEVTNLDDAARRVDPEATGPLTVYVVHYPLRYFAERIGGEFVRVVFPAPTDVDPADWSPDSETVAAYQAADLVLLNGASYARWVQRASLPRARLVDTSAAFRDRLIAQDAATTHIHGPEGAHSHADVAFTTWLDPALAILQARAVANAFAEARPEHEAAFGAGLAALETALGELDARLAEATRAIGETPLLFSHPVYQYFARRYGLNARSLHWEPDEPPDEPAWRALEELLVEHPARSMIWRPFAICCPTPSTRSWASLPPRWRSGWGASSRKDLAIVADEGPPLAGRLLEIGPRERVKRDGITGEGLPSPRVRRRPSSSPGSSIACRGSRRRSRCWHPVARRWSASASWLTTARCP